MTKSRTLKLLSLLCAVAMIFAMIPAASAYSGMSGWAAESVAAMEKLGLVPERLADRDLRTPITREEMCYVAVQAYEVYFGSLPELKETKPFTDTDDEAIAMAYQLGFAKGYTDGTFRPDQSLTRQEFFCLAYRFLLATGCALAEPADLTPYSDGKRVSKWAREATQIMVALGVVKGNGATTLDPTGTASCEVALVLFYRAYTYAADQRSYLDGRYKGYSKWAQSSIYKMDELGLIPTTLRGKNLRKSITRGDMCKVAMLAYEKANPEYEPIDVTDSPFTDTSDPDYVAAWALSIVSGFQESDGSFTFRPNETLTREQFFKITSNYLRVLGLLTDDSVDVDLADYPDGKTVREYAKAPTRLLISLGIVGGNSDGTLTPKRDTTAQEALVMFLRAYDFIQGYEERWNRDYPEDEPSVAQNIVDLALKYVGWNYIWGGKSPSDGGFDCTGLLYYVYGQYGYKLYRTSPWENGTQVDLNSMKPGDVMVFSSTGSWNNITHVAMYIGGGQYIHAANPSRGVVVDTVSWASGSYCSRCLLGAFRIIWE